MDYLIDQLSGLLIVIDICKQDLNTIDTIIYDVIVYIVHVILMYKSIHCYNIITSLDVSQKCVSREAKEFKTLSVDNFTLVSSTVRTPISNLKSLKFLFMQ